MGQTFLKEFGGKYHPELVHRLESDLKNYIVQGTTDKLVDKIARDFDIDRRKVATLVYTEKSYFQSKGQHEAFLKLGVKYYEIVATLDKRTSEMCRYMDGKVFPIEEFEIGVSAPPYHVRCRTVIAPFYNEITQRVQKGDLETGKSRYGDDMTFEEWYKKNVTEQSSGIRIGTNKVDMDYIKSDEFRDKFNQLTDNTKANDSLRNYATAMLEHRKGTDGEDLYIISDKGDLILRKTSGKNELGVQLDEDEIELVISHRNKTYAIHNHPTNIPPTGSDFVACRGRGYIKGFVVTHDGELHSYSTADKEFYAESIDKRIDRYLQKGYSVDESWERTFQDIGKELGLTWQKIKKRKKHMDI